MALTSVGDIYAWGCGSAGRLGFGDNRNRVKPSLLQTRWTAL